MATLDLGNLTKPKNPLEDEDPLGANTGWNGEALGGLIGGSMTPDAKVADSSAPTSGFSNLASTPRTLSAPTAPSAPSFAEGEPVPGGPAGPNEIPVPGPVEPPTGPVEPPKKSTPTPVYDPASYTPVLDTVQENETVQGQLRNILDEDSKLMQTARTRGLQTGAARGLLNSSMAAQAGEQAVIDTAMPIAGADAAAYRQAAGKNVAAQNEAGLFGAGAQQQLTLQRLKGDQAEQLAGIEANYKQMLQASQSAASLFNTVMTNIGAILDDPNTTQEQKQNAVNSQIAMLQAAMAAMGAISNIDLSNLLDFSQLSDVTPDEPGEPGYTPPPPPPPPPSQQRPVQAGPGYSPPPPDSPPGYQWEDSDGNRWQVGDGGQIIYMGPALPPETPG
jgi:hypothetical protein